MVVFIALPLIDWLAMSPLAAEFLGTTLLVLFGNGVVANVVLARTKGNGSGWIVITVGWAFAVFIGVLCSQAYSGAHLNPAVTIGLAAAGSFPWSNVAGYIAAQMAGGIVGGSLVFLLYREHFKITDDADGKLACFCTSPAIRNTPQAVFSEAVGTFGLMLPVLLFAPTTLKLPGVGAGTEVTVGLGTLGALPVAFVVLAIGLCLGGTTGYAINPARDLGPRLAHAFLPVPGKRNSDWGYAWVPVIGPVIGALLAVGIYKLFHG
jgi:glycerol uptake facilitator protein